MPTQTQPSAAANQHTHLAGVHVEADELNLGQALAAAAAQRPPSGLGALNSLSHHSLSYRSVSTGERGAGVRVPQRLGFWSEVSRGCCHTLPPRPSPDTPPPRLELTCSRPQRSSMTWAPQCRACGGSRALPERTGHRWLHQSRSAAAQPPHQAVQRHGDGQWQEQVRDACGAAAEMLTLAGGHAEPHDTRRATPHTGGTARTHSHSTHARSRTATALPHTPAQSVEWTRPQSCRGGAAPRPCATRAPPAPLHRPAATHAGTAPATACG